MRLSSIGNVSGWFVRVVYRRKHGRVVMIGSIREYRSVSMMTGRGRRRSRGRGIRSSKRIGIGK